MADTYFDYVLSKCKFQSIDRVCNSFSLRALLQKSVTETWNNYPSIVRDEDLLFALRALFQEQGDFMACNILGDSMIVYNRCKDSLDKIRTTWLRKEGLNYDSLFNALVDLCWLMASKANCERNGYRDVILLSNLDQINESLRSYLDYFYDLAIKAHNETIYISEGINAKTEHPFIPILYNNIHKESLYYICSNCTPLDLQNEKSQYESQCRYHLTLYYGLTATAALADYILRRFV